MNTIYFDSRFSDAERRRRLFEGQLFVFSPLPSCIALCEFAHQMIQDAFGGADPTLAQFHLGTEEYVAILAKLKPAFVHSPESRRLVGSIMTELGCDPDGTYLDVPRLKSIPHGGDHPSGLTFAIHPHRDTWYSAPSCQMNWWLPVFDLESASALAFHPRYWNRAVRNGSSRFNHYQWNKFGRKTASTNMEQYVQDQPRPEEPIERDGELRPITRAGGILLFSAAQLHSAVPNESGRTRFSIDFRTVHMDDLVARSGAPNADSAATGTSLRDFLRCRDRAPIPEEIVSAYDDDVVTDGELVFQPPQTET